jgi:hypothetical protein
MKLFIMQLYAIDIFLQLFIKKAPKINFKETGFAYADWIIQLWMGTSGGSCKYGNKFSDPIVTCK